MTWEANSVLNVKALVGTFNQEKALEGAFFVITNLRMELFQALRIYLHFIFGYFRYASVEELLLIRISISCIVDDET